MLKINC